MSHISFSSVRIDTTRIASNAGPVRKPSPARTVLYWHAAVVAWLLALIELLGFAAHGLVTSLAMAGLLATLWYALMRRGGGRARAGAGALGIICAAQATTALVLTELPPMLSTRAELYATIAFVAFALFGRDR